MIRFSVLGVKGGVGKSTIAFNLARELSKNYRVLLVDRDYTNTIGKMFNHTTGLINVLSDKVMGKFVTDQGNLRVLSFLSFSPSSLPTPHELAKVYSQFLKDIDVVVIDNPPGVDEVSSLEFKAYYETIGEVHCNGIFVTTPGITLGLTLTHMNDVCRSLREAVPETSYWYKVALVVNMVRGNFELNVPDFNIVTIPFYKELLFEGIMSRPINLNGLLPLVEERIRREMGGQRNEPIIHPSYGITN